MGESDICHYNIAMPGGQYRVYEVVNFDLGEVVIGIAHPAVDPKLLTKNASRLGWKPAQRTTYRVVEDHLSLDDAARFALQYSESESMKAYSVFLGPDVAPVGRP